MSRVVAGVLSIVLFSLLPLYPKYLPKSLTAFVPRTLCHPWTSRLPGPSSLAGSRFLRGGNVKRAKVTTGEGGDEEDTRSSAM
uniref:Putative secreted protein n=1 Tax=Anopheles darlingi TaxID=43151 RepID=A0A2M4D281_ANODA